MADRLREIRRVYQHPDSKLRRRWFSCRSADLYVWEDEAGDIAALELCFGKPRDERALGWSRTHGFRHARVDDGEDSAYANRSPITIASSAIDHDAVALLLEELGARLDPPTLRRVLRVLHLGR